MSKNAMKLLFIETSY